MNGNVVRDCKVLGLARFYSAWSDCTSNDCVTYSTIVRVSESLTAISGITLMEYSKQTAQGLGRKEPTASL